FFQAEGGIRDDLVTGVQTCALPILWAIMRVVVVLPFDPVTATIGMRDGVPSGNSRSITGLATYCASPSVGCVCIRNPGAAFTSKIGRASGRQSMECSAVAELEARE